MRIKKDEVNSLSSDTDIVLPRKFKHILHLYSSRIKKYSIQIPFLVGSEKGSVVYVTADDPKVVKNEFKALNIRLIIIHPEKLGEILEGKRGLRIVVDAGSINSNESELTKCPVQTRKGYYIDHLMREKYLKENCTDHMILCTYDMSKLKPHLVKQLITFHDKLMLTTSNITLIAKGSFNQTSISEDVTQQFIKNELESIVLMLLLRKPLCGVEIIKAIYEQFNVLLSPSTVYPLLHHLEKKGILKCEYGVKNKTYKLSENAKEIILRILEERIRTSILLNNFLQVMVMDAEQK